jgi:hypothetical protein
MQHVSGEMLFCDKSLNTMLMKSIYSLIYKTFLFIIPPIYLLVLFDLGMHVNRPCGLSTCIMLIIHTQRTR